MQVMPSCAGSRPGAMAKPKGKQPPAKGAVAPPTMKAAAPVKDSVLLPARHQADGAQLAQAIPSLRAELTDAFKQALESAYPSAGIEPIVAQTNEPKFGDYQCNNAMALFGQFKGKVHYTSSLHMHTILCLLLRDCQPSMISHSHELLDLLVHLSTVCASLYTCCRYRRLMEAVPLLY